MRLDFLAPALVAALLLAGCGGGDDDHDMPTAMATAAMDRILAAYPERVGFHHELNHWGLATPGGEKLEWTNDTAAGAADVAVVLLAEPLVAAGVDPEALVAAGWIHQAATDTSPALLVKPWDISNMSAGAGHSGDTASHAFGRLLEHNASRVGYHAELQHHGLDLGDGDKVEWTDDLDANDADLAFIFAAEPLVAAGASVDALVAAGWLYTPATAGAHPAPAVLIKPIALN